MDSNPTNENKETDPQMPTAPEGCKNSNIQEESKKESSSESAITQKNETKQNDETEKIEKNIKPNQDSNTTIKNADDDLDKRASHLSHASRRVILNNVYKWSRNNDVEKLIQSIVSTLPEENTVKVAKFKKPPKKDWVSITFETDSMAEAFTEAVKNGKFEKQKGNRKHLFAKVSSDQDDRRDSSDKNNRGNKRGRNENDNSLNEANGGKRGKIESNDEPLDDDGIRDSMTPLWRKPYEDQLKWKWRQMVNKCTKKIAQDLKTTFRYVILCCIQFYYTYFYPSIHKYHYFVAHGLLHEVIEKKKRKGIKMSNYIPCTNGSLQIKLLKYFLFYHPPRRLNIGTKLN